ncbi:MAG TPA: CDGSH iron-sulfur domain-containing protein [Candidatus Omnitrophota bacterium]|nr:CDGSH iron-sulfur domain-containing protein [Candidatus Omnitrophota bacterium]
MNKKIKVTKDGPYLVTGSVPLEKEYADGDQSAAIEWVKSDPYPLQENCALCRCGATANPPYCDGAHRKISFDGTETAKNIPYLEQAETTRGPGMDLTDAESFCAIALFCHQAGDTWTHAENSGDPGQKKMAIREACACPSGRLVAWEKNSGKPIEPAFEPSISVVESRAQKVSGPLWVKGGIPVESASGMQYEVRNRVTLCRCGKSSNKPFCDGTHTRTGFNDGDPSLRP